VKSNIDNIKPLKSNLIIMHIILLWKTIDHAYCL